MIRASRATPSTEPSISAHGQAHIDASVALKWLTPENDSELALQIHDQGADLHAPAFLFIEVANVLWPQVRAGKTDPAGTSAELEDLRTGSLSLFPFE